MIDGRLRVLGHVCIKGTKDFLLQIITTTPLLAPASTDSERKRETGDAAQIVPCDRRAVPAAPVKVNATVVLVKKNVLGFNDFNASLQLDNVGEFLGNRVCFHLVSATSGESVCGAATSSTSVIISDPCTHEDIYYFSQLQWSMGARRIRRIYINALPQLIIIRHQMMMMMQVSSCMLQKRKVRTTARVVADASRRELFMCMPWLTFRR
ncbi:uncharacterized protein LOC141837147 [Curcuma longa]|uniref:uncharacterized protein LOC141837147 n=1 Tax=Curcuma longa TaxID=136217 RepID=UPI003D9F48B9